MPQQENRVHAYLVGLGAVRKERHAPSLFRIEGSVVGAGTPLLAQKPSLDGRELSFQALHVLLHDRLRHPLNARHARYQAMPTVTGSGTRVTPNAS